jgi:hypothetical protein
MTITDDQAQLTLNERDRAGVLKSKAENERDRARLRQAPPICAGWTGVVDREALETIRAVDIRASRVFTDDERS